MAASEWYDHTTYPSQGAAGSSSAARAEFEAIEAGLSAKLPDLAGNGGKVASINSAGTAMTTTRITPAQMKTKAVVALADAAATLTAAQMVDSGIFTITPTVARILTTDTAANIVAAIPDYQVGTWFDFTIVNTAAFDVTLAAGTGITLSGSNVIHKESATWKARIDSSTAITIYNTAAMSSAPGVAAFLATPSSANLIAAVTDETGSGPLVFASSIQAQTHTAFTTAGTSTAYTLTPTPAITAYTAGQSFFVTFNAAPGATPTLAISGVATPPNLVKQLADGTYANIAANDFPANHRSRVTLLSASQALIETMPPVVGARCAVYVSTDQTMATALTFYTLAMDTEVYDVYSEFNTGTYTFTAKDAGKYRICATASMSLGSSGDWGEVAVYAGETRVRTARASTADSSAAKCSPQINTVLILAAGDTVTIRGKFNSGTASRYIDGAGLLGERTFMSIDRIG